MKPLLKRLLGGLALTLALAGGAQAATATLADLLGANGRIVAGDKLFDNWSVSFFDSSDPQRVFDPANVFVSSLDDGGLDPGPGLRFDIQNNELSVSGDGIYAYVDVTIGFQVTVLDPSLRIKDNSLTLSSGVIQVGDDIGFYIREVIGTTPGASDLGEKSVEFSSLDGVTTTNLTDSATFAPQASVWVTKNILVWAADLDLTATLLAFEQRFSQQRVPEPASLALVALGLLAGVYGRRRR